MAEIEKLIITNNPLVEASFAGRCGIRFVEGGCLEVLVAVRDHVHRGHRLHTHPLSGNLRPWESPCKTVVLQGKRGATDSDSVARAEEAVRFCAAHPAAPTDLPPSILVDYQKIDCSLVETSL